MSSLAGLKWIIPAIRVIQIFLAEWFCAAPGWAHVQYIPKVGMTGTARSMRIILAVRLLG